ncbi:MAG: T9SS type A sorting domain-containing protein [Bacteroidia bacterium]|nr:T9SS type A sorting domain-containing protein [Bacteroidia bacterium]
MIQQKTNCAGGCNIVAAANGPVYYCGNPPSSIPLISTGAGSYNQITWSPATYLNNPNIPNPTLTTPNTTINTDYIVTYTDTVTGCFASDTIHVFVAQTHTVTVAICNNSPTTLIANPGAAIYNWTPVAGTTQFLSVNQQGSYYCSENFGNGCVLTESFYVIDTCNISCNTMAAVAADHYYCGTVPNSFMLISTGSNFNQIVWSPSTYLNNAGIMTPTLTPPPGVAINMDYIVTYTDTLTGCTDSDTLHVFVAPYIIQTIAICNNSPATLTANPGAAIYNWFPTTGTTQTLPVNQAGSYYCAENHGNGCVLTHSFYVIDTCNITACSYTVNAGPSIYYCGGSMSSVPTFSASVTPSSGGYTYQWSPSTGLSNPNILNPTVSNVYNQTYTLTVTDTVNNCFKTDTVMALSLPYQVGTLYNCNGSPVTIYNAPGAGYYQWMGGFSPVPPYTQNSTIITAPGNYFWGAFYNGCAVTNSITLVDSCISQIPNVWPGDCNYDLTADYLDFLNISMAYNNTGATRAGASLMWTAQPMADWGVTSYGVDDKHSDCDGNGLVDTADIHAILQNYNNVHPYKMAMNQNSVTNADLYLVANKDTAMLGETVTFDIYLGKPSLQLDSVYAIAYQLKYEAYLTSNVGNVLYTNSWLGNPASNEISMEKQLPVNEQIDCGVGGNDHLNRTGQGKIGEVNIIVTTDNLSGLQYLNVDLQNVFAVTAFGNSVPLNLMGDSVYIDWTQSVGLFQADWLSNLVTVYPNPAKDEVYVNCGKLKVNAINVYDMLGNIVACEKQNTNNNMIRLSGLARGIYNISVQTDKGLVNKRLTVQ